ncbi:hypothetical protein ILUMI_07896 [Ignelater luminosus]|uniref:PiggyBac transposable element-derived protein domain-containing protein n=1 Tax=Ignelater luminosus TaxID=2038154 RepID=A0A8K0D2M2_IGNLU|nr:hypothetical protein ILUMI_07896 [Ignelater luminosus]
MKAILEASDDSFDSSSSDEDFDPLESGGVSDKEDSDGKDVATPVSNTDNAIVWTDPPLLNRQYFVFSETSGLLQQPTGNRPADFYNLLVDDKFYDLIVEQSNIYAEEVFVSSVAAKSRITEWKPLTKKEL